MCAIIHGILLYTGNLLVKMTIYSIHELTSLVPFAHNGVGRRLPRDPRSHPLPTRTRTPNHTPTHNPPSPPHEHLSSTLRQIYVPNKSSLAPPLDNPPSIHTGFAWLGHGAITHRSDIVNFLELMHRLNVSEEEMKMADNYYTILSNRVPEIWFDQGVELGGGQPFTVGVEGDERNDRHVVSSVLLHGHHS